MNPVQGEEAVDGITVQVSHQIVEENVGNDILALRRLKVAVARPLFFGNYDVQTYKQYTPVTARPSKFNVYQDIKSP